jgi:hypothetical protein
VRTVGSSESAVPLARSRKEVIRSAENHHARRTPADRLARASTLRTRRACPVWVTGDPAFPKIGHAQHHRTAGIQVCQAATFPSCSRRTSPRHPPTFRIALRVYRSVSGSSSHAVQRYRGKFPTRDRPLDRIYPALSLEPPVSDAEKCMASP